MFAIFDGSQPPVDNDELAVDHGPAFGRPRPRLKGGHWNLEQITMFKNDNHGFFYRGERLHRVDVQLVHPANLGTVERFEESSGS